MELSNSYIVPVIIALVEVVKRAGLPTRWLPVSAIVLGLIYAYFSTTGYLEGLILGLSAVGLWSGVRAASGR